MEEEFIGNATGLISCAISHTGDEAYMTFTTQAFDSTNTEQFFTHNNISWFSQAQSWFKAGTVALKAATRFIDSVNWDAHANVEYNDGTYSAVTSNFRQDGIQELAALIVGKYRGGWNNW